MRILRKLLKWLAVAVLVALGLAAILATWLVRRAWPQTAGKAVAPGLAAPVSVLRDRWGVPQIYAANEHDLFFAQGYVHAQDRLWQMEFDRRISSGRLSEMLGAGLVPTDRYVLTLGIRRAAQRDWELLEPGTRTLLEAYAQGVNAFVAGHRERLPVEFSLLGVGFAPWTPVDVLAWGKMTAYSLSLNAGLELLRAQLGSRLGAATAARLMPPYEGPVILPAASPERAVPAAAAAPAPVAPVVPVERAAPAAAAPPGPLAAAASGGTAAAAAVLESLLGAPSLGAGSNAWVVHGSRTANGRPLLANDTHLGLSMPSVWYENGLHGGRFDVVGFSFPGVPGVLIGHNRSIAWGISNMCGDVQDVYVETRNARGQLLGPGGWYDPAVVAETVPVRGAKPVVVRVVSSRHGPLIGEVEEMPAGTPPIALRWTALGGDRLLDALIALDLAADWASFRRALARWGSPALNFVYADAAGNIGYQAAGLIPVRAQGHDGEVPVPGASDRYDWRGYVPWDAMPSALNPASGFVVTANNKVVSESYPYHIAYDYADPYRATRIAELLAARPRLSAAEARQVQNDTTSLPAAALRPLLLAVPPAGERERRALAEVRSWDLRFDPASAGATIYYAWYRRLLRASVADVVGPEFMKRVPGFPVNQTPIYVRLLNAGRRPWFDARRPPPRESRDELVRRSFREAVADLAARLGGEPASWRWGKLHYAFLAHQPLGASGIGPLMWLFNGKPVPLPGEAFTVDANTPSYNPLRPYRVGFGVSQRLIVDFQDLGRALAINSTGQNGELFHRHREDQIPLWGRGDYRVQPFSPAAVAAATEERLALVPR
jgi:penicillin amidase